MHQRQYFAWILLAVTCVLLAPVCKHGAAQTDTSRSKRPERDRYSKVLTEKLKSWPRTIPKNTQWPADDNPWAPFDLTRMFEESDLIVRARVRACLYEGPRGKVQHLCLVNTVKDIEAVYKGGIQTDIVEWRTRRQLTIHVIIGTRHTGHWGHAFLRFDRPYLLFLKRVPRDELVKYGHENEQGVFYKINRIWHGAIGLADKDIGVCANSGVLKHRTAYPRDLKMFWSDFETAVAEMAAIQRSLDPRPATGGARFRTKLYGVLAQAAEANDHDRTRRFLAKYPQEVLAQYTGVSLFGRLGSARDTKARQHIVRRLSFLAGLAKDVARFANRRIEATTRPSANASTEKAPQSKQHDAEEPNQPATEENHEKAGTNREQTGTVTIFCPQRPTKKGNRPGLFPVQARRDGENKLTF